MLCDGVKAEKVERYDEKISRQSGFKVRYTEELKPDGRYHVEAHIDMDAVREYVAKQPCAFLLPTKDMDKGQTVRAELARENLRIRLCDKHGCDTHLVLVRAA